MNRTTPPTCRWPYCVRPAISATRSPSDACLYPDWQISWPTPLPGLTVPLFTIGAAIRPEPERTVFTSRIVSTAASVPDSRETCSIHDVCRCPPSNSNIEASFTLASCTRVSSVRNGVFTLDTRPALSTVKSPFPYSTFQIHRSSCSRSRTRATSCLRYSPAVD